MNNNIIIFSSDWKVVGRIVLIDELFRLFEESLTDVPEIASIILTDINALARGATLAEMREQLKKAGVRVHILDSSLLPLLRQVSADSFDAHLRAQVVPDILGLDTVHQRAALEAVINVGKIF